MKWAVAVAAPQQVEKLVKQIAEHPLPYFFPRVRRTIRHRGKRVVRFSPLLFNYVPVCLVEGWQFIFSMRGVLDVIGPLPSMDVDRLRAMCIDGIYKLPRVERFKLGQAVRPATGPFAGIAGVFQEAVEDDATVLIHSFGRMVSIGFELGNLVAA